MPLITSVGPLTFEASFGLVSQAQNIGTGGGANRFDVYSRTSFAGEPHGDLIGARAVRTGGAQVDVLISDISGTARNTLHTVRQAIRGGTGNPTTAASAATGYATAANTAIWNQLRVTNDDWTYWNTLSAAEQAVFLAMTPEQRHADGTFPYDVLPPPQFIWSLYVRFDWLPTAWSGVYPTRFALTVANSGPVPA